MPWRQVELAADGDVVWAPADENGVIRAARQRAAAKSPKSSSGSKKRGASGRQKQGTEQVHGKHAY